MRRLLNMVAVILLVALCTSYAKADAAPLGQGIRGSEGEILSKVTVYAGSGAFDYEDGEALSASFRSPHSIVILPGGDMLVSDKGNQVIRKVEEGSVKTYAGTTFETDEWGLPVGGLNDADSELSIFNQPSGMAADAAGNVYIADASNHAVRKISPSGSVTTVAGNGLVGSKDGHGENAQFYYPQDVAVAKDGTLYVADTLNHVIRKITSDGEVTTLNTPSVRSVEVSPGAVEPAGDYLDGSLKDAKFNEPSALAIDHKGNLYVSDTGNQLIRYIDFSNKTVSTLAGNVTNVHTLSDSAGMYAAGGYADGAALEAAFNFPKGIAVTEENGLIIADSRNHAIRYLLDGRVVTLAGSPEQGYGNQDGINGSNLLHHPVDVAVQQDGRVWIADSYNNMIRELSLYQLPGELPQNQQIKVVLDQQIIAFDAQPEIVNGRTMIPISAVAKELGYDWNYDNNEKSIAIAKDGLTLALKVGDTALVSTQTDGYTETISLEQAPYVKQSRIYIPLRFLSESLGLDVQWHASTRTVILRERLLTE